MTSEIDPETVAAALEAATPGPWAWETESGEWPDHSLVGGAGDSAMWWDFDLGFRFDNGSNARLIAMAPDLAAAYLALAEENDHLRKRVEAANRLADRVNTLQISGDRVKSLYLDEDLAAPHSRETSHD